MLLIAYQSYRSTCRTLDEFLSAYGNLQTVEQLNALNEELRPIMLRRVKEVRCGSGCT